MGKAHTYFKGIRVPANIDFTKSNENRIRFYISEPEKNMQENVSAFESWSLVLYAKCKIPVEMTFKIPGSCKTSLSLIAHKNSVKPNYMRFLFRAWKFTNQMEWFSVGDETCRLLVRSFSEQFLAEDINTINNIPESKPGISEDQGRKVEHILENIFANSEEAIREIECISDSRKLVVPEKLYNQLPNGLFVDVVSEENRVFPTGYIDLWGVNKANELCIFELKKEGNRCLGIISELYFYANYAKDVFLTERFNQDTSSFRGYEVLSNGFENRIKKIHACFLAPKFHREIMNRINEIQKILNGGESDINFHFLKFDQNRIIRFSKCLPDTT